MKRADIARDLRELNGGRTFISRHALQQSLKIGTETARQIVKDLPKVSGISGGYYVGDIAEVLMERRE